MKLQAKVYNLYTIQNKQFINYHQPVGKTMYVYSYCFLGNVETENLKTEMA